MEGQPEGGEAAVERALAEDGSEGLGVGLKGLGGSDGAAAGEPPLEGSKETAT